MLSSLKLILCVTIFVIPEPILRDASGTADLSVGGPFFLRQRSPVARCSASNTSGAIQVRTGNKTEKTQ